jgi:Transposase IS4
LKHGLKVMLVLLDKWPSRGRIVCANSYFASVQAAVELHKIGWRFIGVVKTATMKYPMDFMKSIKLPDSGTCSGMHARHSHNGHEMDFLAYTNTARTWSPTLGWRESFDDKCTQGSGDLLLGMWQD